MDGLHIDTIIFGDYEVHRIYYIRLAENNKLLETLHVRHGASYEEAREAKRAYEDVLGKECYIEEVWDDEENQ